MALAMLIAAVGIYFDQPILIVAAMVVGPDFGPIAGVCVALVNRNRTLVRRSGTALLFGFLVGIAASYLATLLLKGDRISCPTGSPSTPNCSSASSPIPTSSPSTWP